MTTTDLLRAKREEILGIAERHGARDVRVFGSVARGDVRDGHTAFMGDPKTQDAVIRNVEVIGEAAKRVPAE